ncbi:hypothetical protein IE81DRAFT_152446 [Ceraceosorus guamensis]|uniref:Uncharacterized protein n=1 Tax=Ceraceosorus guamensis TaxID=1522189 RepID=A0A316W014_9BASI|nr:hypothetical protein IE81DRAFT_152446 [Ceraceosorus guamensis]PWN41891.1 hypothetical protein IE81DRAFT_152446 [Ceraceosorus guamensis]
MRRHQQRARTTKMVGLADRLDLAQRPRVTSLDHEAGIIQHRRAPWLMLSPSSISIGLNLKTARFLFAFGANVDLQ